MSNNSDKDNGSKLAFLAGYAAIFIVTILIVAKTYAYSQSGSVSILSSLIDSIMDSIVSIMALASIHYASQPADAEHRWGHGKMEAVSALFQSAIIAGGGAFLIFESISHLYSPTAITHHILGMKVMVISIILSIILVMIQRHAIKHTGSLAVEADSVHYGSDVVINAGTIAILGLGAYGAPAWIDPLFAIFVAFFMAYIARGIAIKSLDMLMDRELPDEDRAKIIDIIEANDQVLGWHDLRTRRNGNGYAIAFDIEADAELKLLLAHEIAHNLEHEIGKIFSNAEVMVHIDPHGHMEESFRHRIKGVHI